MDIPDLPAPMGVAPWDAKPYTSGQLRWYVVHANKRVPEVVGPFRDEQSAIEWGEMAIGSNSVGDYDWFIRMLAIPEGVSCIAIHVSRPV